MKSYTVEALNDSSVVVAEFKVKAPDESRAIEVAKRLKKEGKLDLMVNVSFKIKSPK